MLIEHSAHERYRQEWVKIIGAAAGIISQMELVSMIIAGAASNVPWLY